MAVMSKKARELRAELETAMLGEAEHVGPDGFDRAAVVSRFMDRGVSRPTIFRWAAEIVNSGRLGQHVTRKIREAAEERASRSADAARDAAEEVMAKLPPTMTVGDMVSSPGRTIDVIERLKQCIAVADQVIKYARTDSGGVRNSRLLIQASEHLRRSLDTAARLQRAIYEMGEVEKFHQAIFDIIKEEAPEAAERLLMRLEQNCAAWMPTP
jgi:hypothetical protein